MARARSLLGGPARATPGLRVAVFLYMCSALASGCGDDANGRVASVPADGVVARMAPLVHLHEQEGAFPMTARSFIAHSRLVWSRGDTKQLPSDTLAIGVARQGNDDLRAPVLRPARLGRAGPPSYSRRVADRPGCPRCTISTTDDSRPHDSGDDRLREGEGFFLELLFNWLFGEADIEYEGRQAVLGDLPVYFETDHAGTGDRRTVLITYWMLFGVEEPLSKASPPNHEGDWERVAVLLHDLGDERYEPLEVRYYQRGRRLVVPWEEIDAATGGPGRPSASHPVVYLGVADHTPYPRPVNRMRAVMFDGRPVPVRERAGACAECPTWLTWQHLVPAESEPWYGYGGAWGNIGLSEATTGPAGPSPYVER